MRLRKHYHIYGKYFVVFYRDIRGSPHLGIFSDQNILHLCLMFAIWASVSIFLILGNFRAIIIILQRGGHCNGKLFEASHVCITYCKGRPWVVGKIFKHMHLTSHICIL